MERLWIWFLRLFENKCYHWYGQNKFKRFIHDHEKCQHWYEQDAPWTSFNESLWRTECGDSYFSENRSKLCLNCDRTLEVVPCSWKHGEETGGWVTITQRK